LSGEPFINNTQFPKDYRTNLKWRRNILQRAAVDLVFRKKVKELFYRDIIFAFNAFFYTLDVRKRPRHNQPFCTYPYQDKMLLALVEAINSGTDFPIEKSRDMGVSWMIILTFLWFWLNPIGGTDFLLGSRIEDYVDKKGDMRALLPKARYAFYKLPRWLWPEGFNSKQHDNFMRLQNPATGASITGESNNANFSTGGRYAAVMFDEFAKWESTDKSAWTAAGDATPCRIPLSTPFGAGGQYYDLITDPSKTKTRLHWTLHPLKIKGGYCRWPLPENWDGDEERLIRSPWYDRECRRRSPSEIAQELDIDYIGAGSPVFEGRAAQRMSTLLKSKRMPRAYYEFDLDKLKLVELRESQIDHGLLDPTANLFLVYTPPDPKRSYVVAVDVAEGLEWGDFGIIKVLERTNEDVVATVHTNLDEIQLAKMVKMVCEFYGDPWYAIETNGPGLATFDLCAEIYQVPNPFMMPRYDTTKESISYRKGWWTGTDSRRKLVSGLKQWLIEGAGWTDPRCVKEMTTFVLNQNGKPGAKSGCNDDEVLCLGIALQINQVVPFDEKVEEDTSSLRERVVEHPQFPTIEGIPKTNAEWCLQTAIAAQQLEEKYETRKITSSLWEDLFDEAF